MLNQFTGHSRKMTSKRFDSITSYNSIPVPSNREHRHSDSFDNSGEVDKRVHIDEIAHRLVEELVSMLVQDFWVGRQFGFDC